ncbi:MAG: DUF1905 domain-containing protein [Acidimicrobiia bacterium]|nr:DUF1905 domain-containing protein [Acidimicrobiia bacterium]MBT8247245.1 DUF1905 domain-containing protein [Acidimicrobiia bacterium]NNF87013.1 DUF1905 domain-containing protein [Acidimicrobiia bacterium]NNJ47995.1 DUF1905 domain-containing protein [Acidimicrobiia bacterium]RZV46970.1 MAG: DUF1905 domain-containing protein [Acidimicrobiia bacterium]
MTDRDGGAGYSFSGRLFQTETEAAWVFVGLPAEAADEIAEATTPGRGFGSIRVTARIGSTEWQTSLFPSREFGTYLLPIKRAVRERERIDTGESADVWICLIEE